jgi:hypothetical protein
MGEDQSCFSAWPIPVSHLVQKGKRRHLNCFSGRRSSESLDLKWKTTKSYRFKRSKERSHRLGKQKIVEMMKIRENGKEEGHLRAVFSKRGFFLKHRHWRFISGACVCCHLFFRSFFPSFSLFTFSTTLHYIWIGFYYPVLLNDKRKVALSFPQFRSPFSRHD